MTPRFYIIKKDNFNEDIRHYVTPEPNELKDAKNAMKWGMKKGVVSLVVPYRTSTLYWEL